LTAGKDRVAETAGLLWQKELSSMKKNRFLDKTKTRTFFFGMLAIMLAFGLILTGCGDSKTGDPGSPPGGKNGGKPAELAPNATHAEAMAKLDEIIAYSGTPGEAKDELRELKEDIDSDLCTSLWDIPMEDAADTTMGAMLIPQINDVIKQLP
jgi:hypothetical protein